MHKKIGGPKVAFSKQCSIFQLIYSYATISAIFIMRYIAQGHIAKFHA